MRMSPAIDIIMTLAAREAVAAEFGEIRPEHLLAGILKFSEVDPAAAEGLFRGAGHAPGEDLSVLSKVLRERGIDPARLRRELRAALGKGGMPFKGGVLHRSPETRRLFSMARELAAREGADILSPAHLLRAALERPTRLMAGLPGIKPEGREEPPSPGDEAAPEASPDAGDFSAMGMGELTRVLKDLRTRLLDAVFGQDHAIHAFVEGLFSAEVVAASDEERRQPKGIFLFAGPPGVGKTFLAETAAGILGRPFQRFDMSGYSDPQVGVHLLAGVQRSYQSAHPGELTGFVKKHPRSILLFDEIEKAHLNVIHLFLQILDHGTLEDQFTEEDVSFRDTLIIFTTNAGKRLYDDPNSSGVHPASGNFQRKTILGALEAETDPRTGRPFFPQAIVSRLATGYPLMFNHLGIAQLERIAAAELDRMAGLMKHQYGKEIRFGTLVPLCLVLREGPGADARAVRSRAASFVKSEMFNVSRLLDPENFDAVMGDIDCLVFDVDPLDTAGREVKDLLQPVSAPSVLLIADPLPDLAGRETEAGVAFLPAGDAGDALRMLESEAIDMVLLDLWMGDAATGGTLYRFDHVPGAARAVRKGRELLREIHEKHPEIPCYILSSAGKAGGTLSVDDELFLACVRSGGARGVVDAGFLAADAGTPEFSAGMAEIRKTAEGIRRERRAAELAARRKALAFDTAPRIARGERRIDIRLRNFRLSDAVAAEDVRETLRDVERPSVRFSDVFGADAAKAELAHIVRWMKDPGRFSAMGVRPPRGILLYGAPGTGKTLLARALAGECDVTFVVASATGFVTRYVGSGPENVRRVFLRARRYAPSILFIDEIDAVGKKRGRGSHQAYDETLNAILTEMDGFETSRRRPVVVIAATNLVSQLDDALRRRFDREIEVDRPDRAARAAFLSDRLRKRDGWDVSSRVTERLAGQSAGMTIAELDRVVALAGRMASAGSGVVSDAVMEEAFERMRMGEIRGPSDPDTLLRVARHEAGHCLVGWLLGERPVQVSIVARGGAGGFVEREAEEERTLYRKPELEGLIRQAMAGRAAEILYYGDEDGLSTGAAADLRSATRYAERMVRDYGMGEGVGQVFIDPGRLSDGPLAIRVMTAAGKIIGEQMDRAVAELRSRREVLDRLVAALMEKNRLTREELEIILEPL